MFTILLIHRLPIIIGNVYFFLLVDSSFFMFLHLLNLSFFLLLISLFSYTHRAMKHLRGKEQMKTVHRKNIQSLFFYMANRLNGIPVIPMMVPYLQVMGRLL